MAETLKGVFAASMSVLKADLSLDISATLQHSKINLDDNGVGSAFFGSTGCGQLISVSEKKELINSLSKMKFKEQILIGPSCNSLKETINIMNYAVQKGMKNFLVMNPAYYKNNDNGVYNFYSNIIKSVPEARIVLYNFSNLSGYSFSQEVTTRLIKDFSQIVGMKDSTGNLWNNFKSKNFSMFVGSEKKLTDNLKIGGAGVISATTNFSGLLAKKVYDDFKKTGSTADDEKLKDIRSAFDESGNLITALHTLKSIENKAYANLLPPLELLNENKKDELIKKLKGLGVLNNKNMAA